MWSAPLPQLIFAFTTGYLAGQKHSLTNAGVKADQQNIYDKI